MSNTITAAQRVSQVSESRTAYYGGTATVLQGAEESVSLRSFET